MWSHMPASSTFSRSPAIALAVMATIGMVLNCGILRIARVAV